MIRISRFALALIFFLFVHLTVDAEFVYHPKKANLTFHFENNEWVLTNTSSTKTYLKFTQENAYVQIINDEIRVYKISEGLWNAHPSATFLNRIGVSFTEAKIETHPTRFDSYSSFWISSSGGHIRIFKYYEKNDGLDLNGKKTEHINYHNANHLWLNQNTLSHIKSVNTVFMISPQRNIFEIDPHQKIWRFILLNRTLTPWSTEPPTEKMMYHIFKKEDFKKIIPLGSKDNKYYVQIVNHSGRMGIATISHDYFQIEYLIPPQFDFISPSLKNDYHLIYNKGKLGIAYFEKTTSEYEIPMIKAVYTDAKKEIYASGDENHPAPLLADQNKFIVTTKDTTISSDSLLVNMNYGLELINPDLLLYNEYTPSGSVKHSGLFRVSQQRWYLAPEHNQLLRYPNAFLSMHLDKITNQNSYSTFNLNGDIRETDVTDKTSQQFFKVASILTGLTIDTIAHLPNYDPFTYSFRVENKWGVMHIENNEFRVVLPATYDWIDQFGFSKSLILAQNNQFGWYGENLCSSTKATLTPPKSTSFTMYQGNDLHKEKSCAVGPDYKMNIAYYMSYYIFNSTVNTSNGTTQTAWLRTRLHKENALTANAITPVGSFFALENQTSSGKQIKLYSLKLKLVETPKFDSILTTGLTVVLVKKDAKQSKDQPSNEISSSHKVVAAYYDKKSISLNKFSTVYFYNSYFICAKNGEWIILNAEGKSFSDLTYTRMEDALKSVIKG